MSWAFLRGIRYNRMPWGIFILHLPRALRAHNIFQNDSWVGTLLGREEIELLQPPWKNI